MLITKLVMLSGKEGGGSYQVQLEVGWTATGTSMLHYISKIFANARSLVLHSTQDVEDCWPIGHDEIKYKWHETDGF